MQCPSCQSQKLKVLDTRPGAGVVNRRRQCQNCGHRFTTQEAPTGETKPDQPTTQKYYCEKMHLVRAAALGVLALDRLIEIDPDYAEDPKFIQDCQTARSVLGGIVGRTRPARPDPICKSNFQLQRP